jgi:cephalosporin-C deacetylase-like acetyl esterase
LIAVIAALAGSAASAGALIGFKFESDHADSRYRLGEEAVITVTATNGAGEIVKDWHCRVEIDNYGKKNIIVYKRIDFATNNPFVVKGTLREPGFMRIKVQGRDPKGVWFGRLWGVGFEPEKIRPASRRPADFDAFWAKAIADYDRKVPVDAKMEKDEAASAGTHDCYRLTFSTLPAGRVIRGQLAVPKGKGRYPVSMNVPGAGSGSWGFTKIPGRIFLTLNVLDYPKVPEKSEVKKLYAEQNRIWGGKSGCGNTWYFEGDVSRGREDFFYYGAILGINRAVDWVVARPDVDRSRIRYQGTSQGGGFGFYLCALNRNFTRATFFVPAITDTMGYLSGRQSGWPKIVESNSASPKQRAAAEKWAPYFDGANFASRITCPVRVVVGFADVTCAPCAVYAAFNAISSSDKKIDHGIGMGHGCRKEFYRKYGEWLTGPAGRRKCN